MPLKLVTGPANAAKASVVLGAYREALPRGPVLVVPTFADVDHYRRELAADGAFLGARVLRFGRFLGEIARRCGVDAAVVSPLQRERLVAASVAGAGLRRLAASAQTPGFAHAATALVVELGREGITPQRLAVALRAWAAGRPAEAEEAEELTAIYRGYHAALARLGRVDAELHARSALDALRREPHRWGATPVFVYGFDDFTPVQLDAIDALAHRVGVEVTVSLAYEPGRAAFASRARTFEELRERGVDEHVALEARAEHYAPRSRAALHHLERRLFEDTDERLDPGDAVRLLESGGERAELELVGAEVLALLRAGVEPGEIAVVFRSPHAIAALADRVFSAYGIPHHVDRTVAAGHTALGRGLLGLLRCALLEGGARDLLAWLRTPGVVRQAGRVDALEADVRRTGLATAVEARAAWERAGGWPLEALDRIRDAAARGPVELLERIDGELRSMFAGPFRERAPVLEHGELVDARVLAAARGALAELRELAEADRALAPSPAELAAILEALPVRLGEHGGADAVQILDPLAIRARRFRAVFLCGLQEGVFPLPPDPDPFLSEERRREINAASGLRLRVGEDQLAAERHLFYACVSRPEERLVLSYRTTDEDGAPDVPSSFLADVRDLFTDELRDGRRRRGLGEVTWPVDEAPTAAELARSRAARGAAPPPANMRLKALVSAAVLGELRERAVWSPSDLELLARCPVAWLVERYLAPQELAPKPDPMLRGSLAHAVLAATLGRLREQTGSARVAPERLGTARAILREELARLAAERPVSPDPTRHRTIVRGLEADLVRYLGHAAESGCAMEPTYLELRFGKPGDEHGALELAEGEEVLRVAGRIDRIDLSADGRDALVIDYKSKSGHAPPLAKWEPERHLQVALYALAVRDVLGLNPVGAVYQPLRGKDLRPRGALDADALVLDGLACVANDTLPAGELMDRLDEVGALALDAWRALLEGRLQARPESCGHDGSGCRHPWLCGGGA